MLKRTVRESLATPDAVGFSAPNDPEGRYAYHAD